MTFLKIKMGDGEVTGRGGRGRKVAFLWLTELLCFHGKCMALLCVQFTDTQISKKNQFPGAKIRITLK